MCAFLLFYLIAVSVSSFSLLLMECQKVKLHKFQELIYNSNFRTPQRSVFANGDPPDSHESGRYNIYVMLQVYD